MGGIEEAQADLLKRKTKKRTKRPTARQRVDQRVILHRIYRLHFECVKQNDKPLSFRMFSSVSEMISLELKS